MADDPRSVVVEAILFDMDGTLVDSNAVVDAMWTDFAVHHGLDVSAVLRHAHGTPSISTLRRFLPQTEDIDTWFATVARWESEHFGQVRAMAGASAVLAAVPAHRWAVVTSALADAARIRLASVALPVPPVLIGADDVQHGKPAPEGFLAAAAALGVDPRRCLVAEDSPAGIAAALAAGCSVVVMGDSDHHVTEGLPRLKDWQGVKVLPTDGGVVVTFPAA